MAIITIATLQRLFPPVRLFVPASPSFTTFAVANPCVTRTTLKTIKPSISIKDHIFLAVE